MRRLDHGAPIREAMKRAGLDIPTLAAKTKEFDPTGTGLSKSLVGFIAGRGRTAREECSDRAAQVIAATLGQEVGQLFEVVTFMVTESTSTRGQRIVASRTPLPDQLMDQRALAEFLGKSSSWIDEQIKENPEWPGLIYVGRSRRFNPYEVIDAMRESASV
jgi:predicted DNA-binding transcriptional regulator AlpA